MSTNPFPFLSGVYLRNGPLLRPHEHLFDGDGWIHYVHFTPTHVFEGSALVQTHRLRHEQTHQTDLFHRIGELTLGNVLRLFLKRLLYRADPFLRNGEGSANTSIVSHAHRLLALNESDYPYELTFDVETHTLHTVGRYDFGGRLTHPVNAHPHIDPDTGEMFLLGYTFFPIPTLHVSCVDPDGVLVETSQIHMPAPLLAHDWGCTHRFLILLDFPLVFRLTRFLTFRYPIHYDTNRPCRIGLMSRVSRAVRWVHVPIPLLAFHVATSWDEGDKVFLWLVCYDTATFDIREMAKQRPVLKEIVLHIPSLQVMELHTLSSVPVEMPTHDPKQPDTVYTLKIGEEGFDGICKYSVSTRKEEVMRLPEGKTCSEVAVVDETHFICFVDDARAQRSELHVYDGTRMVCVHVFSLSERVPFGFHGTFVETL